MSLDVYLKLPGEPAPRSPRGRIFVRRDGATTEMSREEWDARYPGREPHVAVDEGDDDHCVYDANITHNLGRMAAQCGTLYEALWRPDEIGITHAEQLIEHLRAGLEILVSDEERLQEFNPANGWGNYELLVSFTWKYLEACERWPQAEVSVWR